MNFKIVFLTIFILIFAIGCDPGRLEPDRCVFEDGGNFGCSDFLGTTSGIKVYIRSAFGGNFTKLKVTGDCNDEVPYTKWPNPFVVCKSGLKTGQKIALAMELTYTQNGVQKVVQGTLRTKIE